MSIYIIQISDTHILADPAATFDGVDSAATLQQVLAAIQAADPPPDLILLTGDLVHEPDTASYARLADLLRVAPVPVYCLPGNHDDPRIMRAELNLPPFRHDKQILSGDWQILLLDSWLPGHHAGQLATGELEWLQQSLASRTDLHALIALHHPPVPVDSPWMDAMGLRNPEALLGVIDRYPRVRAVIWGHIHQKFEQERQGVQLLSCPSTCVQFLPGSERYAVDTLAPGYRRMTLQDDGRLETEVVRIKNSAKY